MLIHCTFSAIFYKVISGCADHQERAGKDGRYFLNLSNILMVFYRLKSNGWVVFARIKNKTIPEILLPSSVIQLFTMIIPKVFTKSNIRFFPNIWKHVISYNYIHTKSKNIRKILNFISLSAITKFRVIHAAPTPTQRKHWKHWLRYVSVT